MLAQSAAWADATARLAREDKILRGVIRRVGPCTLQRSGNYFLTLVEAIVWQQLSWSAACAIYDRMLAELGTRRPRPTHFLDMPRAKLRATGLSRAKCDFLLDLASFFDDGRFPRGRIHRLDDEEVIALLTEIKGIGRWTAEMFLIFGLNRPDVFPVGDLGLRKTVGRYYDERAVQDFKRAETIAKRWRPYRTVATWYLWRHGDEGSAESG